MSGTCFSAAERDGKNLPAMSKPRAAGSRLYLRDLWSWRSPSRIGRTPGPAQAKAHAGGKMIQINIGDHIS
jgi:hypothetical protein